MLTKTSEIHSRSLRSGDNDKLRVPFARTNYFAKPLSVEGAEQWNVILVDIRQTSNIRSFKTALRSHLLHSKS